MEKIIVKENDVKEIVNNIVDEMISNQINEGPVEIERELGRVKQLNSDALGHLKFIKKMLEGNNPAHTKNFVIGYVNGVIKEIEYSNAISKGNGRPNDFIAEDLNETLSYQEFKGGSKLEALRNAIEMNKTVSVVFVKKDGTVRPMAVRKHFKYEFKTGQDFQPSAQGLANHKDFYNVFDINVYIKLKRQTGSAEEAAKGAWRKIILGNVLGFLAGGHFYDLRQENNIKERFGVEVYNQLTNSMAKAAEKELNNVNASEQANVEPQTSQMGESIRNQVEKLISESTKPMRNKLYKAIQKSKLTSRSFNDESWVGVSAIIELLRSVDGVLDVSCGAKNGGYRKNAEGTQWKEYELEIDTIQGTIKGNLNAHAAGTVEDPFNRYDITVTLW